MSTAINNIHCVSVEIAALRCSASTIGIINTSARLGGGEVGEGGGGRGGGRGRVPPPSIKRVQKKCACFFDKSRLQMTKLSSLVTN